MNAPGHSGVKKHTPDNYISGIKGVMELLEKSPEVLEHIYLRKDKLSPALSKIMDLARNAGLRFTLLERAALDRICPGNHQGVAARLGLVPWVGLETMLEVGRHSPLPLILALDQVQDPGNVGTLARTLYALGGAGFILPKHNSAYLGPDAMRASAGTLPLLTISRVTNLGDALEKSAVEGFNIYAAEAEEKGGKNVFAEKLELPAVLVLGGEEKGVRPGVLKAAPGLLSIPFAREFDSLNVAQAGAIIMSQFTSRGIRA